MDWKDELVMRLEGLIQDGNSIVRARLIDSEKAEPVELHFGHAVDRGVGYGQLWLSPSTHLEFTKAGLLDLAAQASQLAEGL